MRLLFILMIPILCYGMDKTTVDRACKAYEMNNCDLVHALVWTESAYRSVKVLDTNDRYSYGPLQIQCATAKSVGLKYGCEQLVDNPMIGLRFGIAYIKEQLERYGNVQDAIAAYNAGSVYRCKTVRTVEGRVACYTGEYVNYNYVNKVMRRYRYLTRDKIKVSMTDDRQDINI
jgi:soluble lytic murein transglycosylase-like protein